MNDALPSGMLVSALLRRVNDAGGMAFVRARGDAGSGGILLILLDRNSQPTVLERGFDPSGRRVLLPSGPAIGSDEATIEAYWRRRSAIDSDLWVVELDIASAERFAAETILGD